MNLRPYILLGKRRTQNLSQRFEGVLKVWVEDWLGQEFSDYQVDAVKPIQSSLKKRQQIQRIVKNENGAWCALMWSPEILENLASNFWQDTSMRGRSQRGKSKVVKEVVMRALENMMEPLMGYPITARRFDEENMQFPEDPLAEGQGAISLSVRIRNSQINFVLSSRSVQKWLEGLPAVISSKAPVLQPVGVAMDESKIGIHVDFGGTELRMSELASLEEGDVLRLDSKIEDPVSIIIHGTTIDLKGYVGKHAQNMAIRLVENE